MSNQNTYKTKDVVEYYSKESDLQPPELTILNLLRDELSEMTMLDIGVGGGRTTLHFAKLVKRYVGVDYSEEMVAVCRKRFSEYPGHVSFEVSDVRSMKRFKDNTFDFILFSFNGLDHVYHEDRLPALSEIQRVGKRGAYFCFSTHNLQSADRLFGLKDKLSSKMKKNIKFFIQWIKLSYYNRKINAKQLKESPYALINDGVHNFSFQTYYIKPAEQIKQLSDHFTDVKVYSLSNGGRIKDEIELNTTDDSWLYYLCKIK